MDNLIIKPGYVSQFQCVGPECEDSCCYDWRISFDKKSYKNTIKHPLLATTAKTAFIETKKSTSDWADIRLNAQGSCPFVNEHKLCDIHAKAGEQALSHTCKTYPRIHKVIGGNKYESLYLSCPEVARSVLFNPNAFQFDSNISGIKQPSTPSPTWLEKTHEYSLDLLLNLGGGWQQALLAIGLLIKVSDQVRQNILPIEELDKRLQQLKLYAQSGALAEQYKNLPYSPLPQTHAFITVHNELCKTHSRGVRARFTSLNQAVAALCNEENNYQIDALNQAWAEYAVPALVNHKELFERYILYSIYHYHFPLLDSQQLSWEAFRLLVLDCFMIRSYLSAMAFKNKGLSESDIVMCFQLYQVVRQHKIEFVQSMSKTLEECGIDSVPAAICLLKTNI